MYLIVLGDELKAGHVKKTVFDIWYIFIHDFDDAVRKWNVGTSLYSCLDQRQISAHFSSFEGYTEAMNRHGLQVTDFDTPSEFCRKKNIKYIEKFWRDVARLLFLSRIWIHRGSDLKGD